MSTRNFGVRRRSADVQVARVVVELVGEQVPALLQINSATGRSNVHLPRSARGRHPSYPRESGRVT